MGGEDLAWLEGPVAEQDSNLGLAGPVFVPVQGATKRDIADATGYPLKRVDRMVREGLPSRSTGSKRGGLRFDLPAVIEWLIAKTIADHGGGDDNSLAAAKRRNALAQARAREIANATAEGKLIDVDAVIAYEGRKAAELRTQILALPSQVMGLSPEQRDQLNAAIHDMMTEISSGNAATWDDTKTINPEEPSEEEAVQN